MFNQLLVLLAIAVCAAMAVPQTGCGIVKPSQSNPIPSPDRLSKIVGGNQAQKGAWPWMCSLRRVSIFGEYHTCGSQIIDKKWVVTAAHCVNSSPRPTSFRVECGREHRDNTEGNVQTLSLSRVIMHPRYNQGIRYSADYALLELATEADFSGEWVKPLCLPTEDSDGADQSAPQNNGVITGWGGTQGTCCTNWLKQAPMNIHPNSLCGQDDILGSAFDPVSMVCGGPLEGGIDTCQGDSGGPMASKSKKTGKWQLTGITSWGYGCAQPNKPGAYTRVFAYADWVKQVTGLEPPAN